MNDNSEIYLSYSNNETIKRILCGGIVLPPFPNVRENVENIRNLIVRKNDVFILAHNNCGTHWLWEVIMMLLHGEAEFSIGIKEDIFLEMATIEEINALPSPKVVNTHLYPHHIGMFPWEAGAKVILVSRNPNDALVSEFYHVKRSNYSQFKGTFEQFYRLMMSESNEYQMNTWISFHRDWERFLDNNKQIDHLIMYYEDMKEDLLREVKRVAQYLQINLDEEIYQQIADSCSFHSMKEAKGSQRPKEDAIYRKGQSGKWKEYFTVSMDEEYKKIFEEFKKTSRIAANIRFTI